MNQENPLLTKVKEDLDDQNITAFLGPPPPPNSGKQLLQHY